MRRFLALMLTGSMVIAVGCSGRYDVRLQRTLEERRYAKQLDDNLQNAPAEGPLKERNVFIRPPKPMELAKEATITVPEGQFDVVKTFYEGTKSSLHVLAREKQAKKAAAKGAPAPPPPVAREPFNVAVLNAVKSSVGDDENLVIEKFKDEKFRANTFKKLLNVPLNGKEYQIYLFKEDPYEVALVFGFDPADRGPMSSKIKLCLEAFAVGNKARNKYNNGGSEEEPEGASPGVAF